MKTNFIPGIILNEKFYFECVKPLFENEFPNIKYSTTLLGYGSDVLGLDNPISMDHNWGPRLQIILSEEDHLNYYKIISEYFSKNLPLTYKGFSTNFTDPRKDDTQKMKYITEGPVNHLIEIQTIKSILKKYLGTDKEFGLSNIEWLMISEQGLIEFINGKVFHDGLEKINKIRDYYSCYPKDVLILKMISLWHGILNEEAFVGRCLEVNDLIGCRLILNRIVNNIMKLYFYYDNHYIPYSKWFGSYFIKLNYGKKIIPIINKIFDCSKNKIIFYLTKLYLDILQVHNLSGFTKLVEVKVYDYYGRPYTVINAERLIKVLKNEIKDKELLKLKLEFLNIEQILNGYDLTNELQIIKRFLN